MRRKSALEGGQKEADIMIVPLADVSFTILITLMVLTPVLLLTSKLHVNLPVAATVEPPQEKNISITITSDNVISVNNVIVSREELPNVLEKTIRKNPKRLIYIRADQTTRTDAVMTIIGLVKRLGAERISIATIQR
ncbi:biopolymer transporter ExbD [candidate division WOR-3 bacterium]|nr:biopolymer transporter ExbD [candidate division WOR-3 bacterium]